MTRLPIALAGAAALLAAIAGCTTAPATAPAPTRDTATACSGLLAMDAAIFAYPSADPSAPPPTADALKQWTSTVMGPFGVVATNLPAELAPSVATVRTALGGTAEGRPVDSEDPALNAAVTAIDKWGHDTCGYPRLTVTGNGTDLPGVPATLPAGPVSISFDNGGSPEKGGFVLLVAKVKDGAAYTLDGIRAGSVDFQSVADVVAAVQPVQGTGYGQTTLEPGKYLVVSPVGTPPAFTATAAAELAVS